MSCIVGGGGGLLHIIHIIIFDNTKQKILTVAYPWQHSHITILADVLFCFSRGNEGVLLLFYYCNYSADALLSHDHNCRTCVVCRIFLFLGMNKMRYNGPI